ncbi:hypothetical protein D0Y65_041699, partial [Glycine soja]
MNFQPNFPSMVKIFFYKSMINPNFLRSLPRYLNSFSLTPLPPLFASLSLAATSHYNVVSSHFVVDVFYHSHISLKCRVSVRTINYQHTLGT